jgi:hypothetical protein
METIACFVARTRGPVVPFVDDWYPWAYAHHYLRTEIENMPLELGRVLSSVRVDDAVAIIHGWCAATGEDVDEAVHLLADAYLERWGLTPPVDRFAEDAQAGLEDSAGSEYDEEYGAAREDVYATGDDEYTEDVEDPTEIIPVVRERFGVPDEEAEPVPAEAARPTNGDRSGKADRPAKGDRGRTPRPGPPRPSKASDRALVAEQILAADQALVAGHPLVTGRSLARR